MYIVIGHRFICLMICRILCNKGAVVGQDSMGNLMYILDIGTQMIFVSE